eukprot:TRINITY_DN2004_c0_g2_i1.p1 TRINITY_DN2004_c0_g2~~TRINITY_DN2004_c0_g2_i1.p1  ORF type:complete len:424 (+),score=14.68 TRINITY_DN2004_c0_g2_i1:366-1637(+)
MEQGNGDLFPFLKDQRGIPMVDERAEDLLHALIDGKHLPNDEGDPEFELLMQHVLEVREIPISINSRSVSGQTLLHLCCVWKSSSIASFLLDQPGININCVSDEGESPLDFARRKGLHRIVSLLQSAHNRMVPFTMMPRDVQELIFSFLTPCHFSILSQVSKAFRSVADSNAIWSKFVSSSWLLSNPAESAYKCKWISWLKQNICDGQAVWLPATYGFNFQSLLSGWGAPIIGVTLAGYLGVGKTSILQMTKSLTAAPSGTRSRIFFVMHQGKHRWIHGIEEETCSSGSYIMIYDVTNRASFDHIRLHCKESDSDHLIMIIANKCDLSCDRVVSYQEGADLAKEFKVPVIECSAKNPVSVHLAMLHAVHLMLKTPFDVPRWLPSLKELLPFAPSVSRAIAQKTRPSVETFKIQKPKKKECILQ